jgi:hypothetical protein
MGKYNIAAGSTARWIAPLLSLGPGAKNGALPRDWGQNAGLWERFGILDPDTATQERP